MGQSAAEKPFLEIDEVFSFHPATPQTGPAHDAVRSVLRDCAHALAELIPSSPEATTALRKLQEAMMFANAAIAIHGVPDID